MYRKIISGYLFTFILLICSCEMTNSTTDNAQVVERGETIVIIDRSGKEWDVTHAVNKYGFVASQFQYGLGPHAIRPILDPQMLSPGESGYPPGNSDHQVIGTTIEEDTRAYPLSVLSRHEIADEQFGDQYVAVAY